MKAFNEMVREKTEAMRASNKADMARIDKPSNYIGYLIAKHWEEISKGEGTVTFSAQGPVVTCYLDETQNIEKDVSLFVESIQDMAKGVTGADCKVRSDQWSVDYEWYKSCSNFIKIQFWYRYGACRRRLVKIVTEIKEVPVYELVCS